MIKIDGKDGRVIILSILLDYNIFNALLLNFYKGYLRCGKVLQMMGKPEKALEIYNYGLRVLPSELSVRNASLTLKGTFIIVSIN